MTEADLVDVAGAEQEKPAWSASQFAEELGQPCGWQLVARLRSSGLFAGYICCRSVAGEAEIVKFSVVSSLRRQGLGRALLEAAVKRMAREQIDRCFLEVRASNEAARCLYEQFGFQRAGLRRNYYSCPDEDALLYQLLV